MMLENEERHVDELEDDDDVEEIDDDDDGELPEEDDEDDEGTFEELLTQRSANRRTKTESDEDDEDIMSLVPEPDLPTVDPPPAKLTPVKAHEFVCANCRLVKKRSQLADPQRMLCRDCV